MSYPLVENLENALQAIDDDEDEINKLILSPEERRLKTIIWNNLNKDWIEEQREKRRKKKEERKKNTKKNKHKQTHKTGKSISILTEFILF